MTLLIRDEEDIIDKNISFHLKHGVDFIIATDNGLEAIKIIHLKMNIES
jgi:hypothetical protein